VTEPLGPTPTPTPADPWPGPESTSPEPEEPVATAPQPATPLAAAGPAAGWGQPAWGNPQWAAQPAWGHPGWNQAPWAPPGWGGSTWGTPAGPPPPPARSHGRTVAFLIALFVVAAASGVGVTYATRSSSPSSPSALLPIGSSSSGGSAPPVQAPGAAQQTTPAPLPTVPAGSSSGGNVLTPSQIASAVDPALVDITVDLNGQGTAEATGMILTPSGEVLTNNHVVDGATAVTVQVDGTGPTYQATVLGVDPTDDVALIQMTGASNLPTIPLGDSSTVAVNDTIVALGNALGRGGTPATTPGTVTALDQTITATDNGGANPETLTGMIQVQAGIQPGDSGGPFVDRFGHVVAMTTAGSARARRSGTVGFGIPINKAMDIARQIQSGSGGSNIQAGVRGIMGVSVDSAATNVNGASVVQVQTGSPAAAAGIAAGAVITGVDSTTIDSASSLSTAMQGRKPGDKLTVHWTDAGGQQHSATLTLESGPPA
jgi:S1-C subfamily serine protease